MKNSFQLTRLFAKGVLALWLVTCSAAIAQEAPTSQRPDSTPATNPSTSFRRPLRVSDIRIPTDWQFRRTVYLFTLEFPADAVESLEKLTFEQIEGVDYPHYQPDDSYAFTSDFETNERSDLSISTTDDDRARSITVEFDPPVAPGRQVTVALRARNPRDGIYLYRLTAFPVGASEGQYAGIERFNIYAPSRRHPFHR